MNNGTMRWCSMSWQEHEAQESWDGPCALNQPHVWLSVSGTLFFRFVQHYMFLKATLCMMIDCCPCRC